MKNVIYFVYTIVYVLSFIAAYLHIQTKINNHERLYCYFSDKSWRRISIIVAKRYDLLLSKLFAFDKKIFSVIIRTSLYSLITTVSILFIWRAITVNSISLAALSLLKSSIWMVVTLWSVVAILSAIASIFTTKLFVAKLASCSNGFKAVRFIILNLICSYLIIALSMYICMIATLPILAWHKFDYMHAKDLLIIISSFSHVNALKWPINSVIELDGLSAIIISVSSMIPSVTFIFSILISMITMLAFKAISPVLLKTLNWLSLQDAQKITFHITALCLTAGALAALGKLFELI